MTMLLTRRSMLAAGLLPFLPATAWSAIEIIEAGAVEKTVGEAVGLFNGETRTLQAGAKVFIDDMLRTGAKARLSVKLGEKTRLSLGERTRVKIDRFIADQGGELVLERGAMLFDRPDDEPHSPLSVTTPFGLIVARGTKFFVGPTAGQPSVFVERGLVNVQIGLSAVTLVPGEGIDLIAATRAPPRASRWRDKRIQAAYDLVS
jgi:ferric-dicitrate binding protein FerR (iron transport regulator)